MKRLGILVLGLALAACGNSDGSNGDGGTDGGTDGSELPPVCGPAEFAVTGNAGGVAVNEKMTVAGQALVNEPGDTGCYVNVYFEGGGRLRLEWDDTLATGQSAPATGSVNLEVHGKINLGSCSTGDKTSVVTLLEDGVEFTLRDLAEAP
jgi:hypothetical protein